MELASGAVEGVAIEGPSDEKHGGAVPARCVSDISLYVQVRQTVAGNARDASKKPRDIGPERLDMPLHGRLGPVRIALCNGVQYGRVFFLNGLVLRRSVERNEPEAKRPLVKIAQEFGQNGVFRRTRDEQMKFPVEQPISAIFSPFSKNKW